MKQVLYFLAGALVGLGGGYLLGKRHKNKENTQKIVEKPVEMEPEEEEFEEEEVIDVVRRQRYVPVEDENEDEIDDDYDIQDDIEEVDDYICELEHPEDDDERPGRAFERITDDDYYTSKSDFDKIRLTLDYSERSSPTLMDSLGNDMADIFARNGISMDDIYIQSAHGGDLVYYRCWKMDSDYEIAVEDGGSE